MRRILFLFFSLLVLSGSVYAQRMSDEQVITYVKQAQAAGKSQKQMTTELLRRGVTQEQVQRIKSKYEENGSADVQNSSLPAQMRKRSVSVGESKETTELDDQAMDDARLDREFDSDTAGIKIFGHNLFQNRHLSFEPSVNIGITVKS